MDLVTLVAAAVPAGIADADVDVAIVVVCGCGADGGVGLSLLPVVEKAKVE